MVVVVSLVVVAVVICSALFLRSVFGGATFRRQRRKDRDRGDGRGPRADAHAGASEWPGAGGLGRWGTWNDTGS